jgi:hypothetical protein
MYMHQQHGGRKLDAELNKGVYFLPTCILEYYSKVEFKRSNERSYCMGYLIKKGMKGESQVGWSDY